MQTNFNYRLRSLTGCHVIATIAYKFEILISRAFLALEFQDGGRSPFTILDFNAGKNLGTRLLRSLEIEVILSQQSLSLRLLRLAIAMIAGAVVSL